MVGHVSFEHPIKCLNCGYILYGLPAGTPCPECGERFVSRKDILQRWLAPRGQGWLIHAASGLYLWLFSALLTPCNLLLYHFSVLLVTQVPLYPDMASILSFGLFGLVHILDLLAAMAAVVAIYRLLPVFVGKRVPGTDRNPLQHKRLTLLWVLAVVGYVAAMVARFATSAGLPAGVIMVAAVASLGTLPAWIAILLAMRRFARETRHIRESTMAGISLWMIVFVHGLTAVFAGLRLAGDRHSLPVSMDMVKRWIDIHVTNWITMGSVLVSLHIAVTILCFLALLPIPNVPLRTYLYGEKRDR